MNKMTVIQVISYAESSLLMKITCTGFLTFDKIKKLQLKIITPANVCCLLLGPYNNHAAQVWAQGASGPGSVYSHQQSRDIPLPRTITQLYAPKTQGGNTSSTTNIKSKLMPRIIFIIEPLQLLSKLNKVLRKALSRYQ